MSTSAFRPGSEEEWEELMRQLRLQKAAPSPFFYARVHGRLLARAGAASVLPTWLLRPAYAVGLCALVLAVSGDGAAAPTSPSHQTDQPGRQVPRYFPVSASPSF